MPAIVPKGRLAMCQAMVRRNWRVVIRQGASPGPGGTTCVSAWKIDPGKGEIGVQF
jgi:hypothetical protein